MTVFAAQASATGQIGDVLTLDGKKYEIQTNPLRPWLEGNPEKIPESNVWSSDNWRGYIASWEIDKDRLLLRDIKVLVAEEGTGHDTDYKSVISEVFPQSTPILAEWFTGHIIIPTGKLVKYVHMGYASTYDKYVVLRIESGNVTRRWTPDRAAFETFRNEQFAAFKKTSEYQKALVETMSGKDRIEDPAVAEEFLRQYYSETYMSRVFD
jgi:hypothetical protein